MSRRPQRASARSAGGYIESLGLILKPPIFEQSRRVRQYTFSCSAYNKILPAYQCGKGGGKGPVLFNINKNPSLLDKVLNCGNRFCSSIAQDPSKHIAKGYFSRSLQQERSYHRKTSLKFYRSKQPHKKKSTITVIKQHPRENTTCSFKCLFGAFATVTSITWLRILSTPSGWDEHALTIPTHYSHEYPLCQEQRERQSCRIYQRLS